MPPKVIATVAAVIAIATIGLVVVLWWAGTAGLSGAELVNARFNALRTGLSIGVGGGGIFALYLAWRRQHATEIGLVQKERDQADVARAYELQRETAEHTRQHAERVAATTERDAEARRITDLYAKSVEQLGSDKAPVRHGGLYALERLAQDHPDNPALRQTVVNVLCAYLRAPVDLPGNPPDVDAPRAVRDEYREQAQEREVRLTAQRILTTHLCLGDDADRPAETFWADTDLDLTDAVLIDWNMNDCVVRAAEFYRTTFDGPAFFIEATFNGVALFSEATFTEHALFDKAKFTKNASFREATSAEYLSFTEATFTEEVFFNDSSFGGDAWFDGTTFTDRAMFSRATFNADALFSNVMFAKRAFFSGAAFTADSIFSGATFSEGVTFSQAMLRYSPSRSPHEFTLWPTGWRPSSSHAAIEGREGTWHRILRTEVGYDRPVDPTLESTDD